MEKADFVQNDTTIIMPDDTRRATNELPCRKPATHFGAKLEARRQKKCFIFFALYNLIWHLDLQISFSEKLIPSPPRKIVWFECLSCFSRLLNPDWLIQISHAPAECKQYVLKPKDKTKEIIYHVYSCFKSMWYLLFFCPYDVRPRMHHKLVPRVFLLH